MGPLYSCCAGLDVHKSSVYACVRRVGPGGKAHKQVRAFGTMTADLLALLDWLRAEGVTHAAMESTGVYWKPVFNILEGHVEVILVNARHIKQAPGRKTDVKDAEWIAELLQHGLLRASFVPPPPIRELRDLTRQRTQLVAERASAAHRIQKVLEDANIKPAGVASDVPGMSGRAMLESICAGEEDPVRLAELARRRPRGKIPQLREALRGRVTAHHRFLLRLHLDHVKQLEGLVERVEGRVGELIESDRPPDPPQGEASACASPGAEGAPPPAPPDAAGTGPLGLWLAVRLLMTIPGIGRRTAEVAAAEVGTDMGRFSTAAHLASWAGLCPGNDESAGKRRGGRVSFGDRWLKQALVQAAWAASRAKGTYLASQYRRLARRHGRKRALVAVAHTLLVIVYHVLKRRMPYQELGADYLERRAGDRLAKHLVRRLESLGLKVTLEPRPAA